MDKHYIGHPLQTTGVEEYRMIGGKADGMRFYSVRNGLGLEFTVSADRAADITRLTFQGANMSYISPCGYTAPTYYDKDGTGFLKSFTSGFITTCGLNNIGIPCEDEGESFGLHGTISHLPAEHIYYTETDDEITISAEIRDAEIFRQKLILKRQYKVSKTSNHIEVLDSVENEGSRPEPLMMMYHMNMGYPLLDEHSFLSVSSNEVEPRDERAAEGIGSWHQMLPPTANFEEQCYYHHFNDAKACAKLYSPTIRKGLAVTFYTDTLNIMTQWKMMGQRDYVLGMEPCNHKLYGRRALRENNDLKYINPGETISFRMEIDFFDNQTLWENK